MRIDIESNRENKTICIKQIDDDDVGVNITSVSLDEWVERKKEIRDKRRWTYIDMCTAISFLLEDR